MTTATQSSTLAELALPKDGALRLAGQLGLVVAGTLVLTIASKAKVPLGIVDLNLGTLAVMGLGVAFGWRLALATLALYMAEGALGLPVFQSTPEKGIGLAYMMGPTGGFLAGYVVLGVIAGWAADRGLDRGVFRMAGVLLAANAVMMAMGYAWLSTLIGAEKAWLFGVAPFIQAELIKVALVATAGSAVWSLLRRFGLGR